MIEMLEPIPKEVEGLRSHFQKLTENGFSYEAIFRSAVKDSHRYATSGPYVTALRFFESDGLSQSALAETPLELWEEVAPKVSGGASWVNQALQTAKENCGSNIEKVCRVVTLLTVASRQKGSELTPQEALSTCHEIVVNALMKNGNSFFRG